MDVSQPNYRRIYLDILDRNITKNKDECKAILNKNKLTALDVIKLNTLIFGTKDKETIAFNQSHRSYKKSSVLEILHYQKKNGLNNSKTAEHFKVSRNTLAKWKKIFF